MNKSGFTSTLKFRAWYKEKYLWYIIAGFFAIHMVTSPFVVVPDITDTGPTWLGIDDSWAITFNHALLQQWTWGEDITYTYGPLAFLATRVGYGIPRWLFLFFDMFIVVNFFFVFLEFIRKSADKFIAILIVFGITLLIQKFIGVGMSWLILFLVFRTAFKTSQYPMVKWFIYLSLLITLSFCLKLNTGLVGCLLFVCNLINLVVCKKISLKKALLLPLPFLFISLASMFLNISIPGYIKGAFELIKGYNDVMGLDQFNDGLEKNVNLLFVGILGVYALSTIVLLKQKSYIYLFYVGAGIGYLFLIKKQSTIRNDFQHLEEFFGYTSLMLLYGIEMFQNRQIRKYYLRTVLVVTLASLVMISGIKKIDISFTERYEPLSNYIREFKNARSYTFLMTENKRYIPERILKKIGRNTIDVFPWDSEYILQNKLNYLPRPVFQSFSAYTSYLQQLNVQAYTKRPPEFILYDYDAIDNRHPFNEECPLHFFILKNYQLADTFTSNGRWRILLQKKVKISPVRYTLMKQEVIKASGRILIPDSCSYIKINMSYNRRGMANSFFNKSASTKIVYTDERGDSTVWKTSTELLKAGIMVKHMMEDNRDFASLFMETDNLKSVKEIQLLFDSTFFCPEMKIEYYRADAIRKSSETTSVNYSFFKENEGCDLDGDRVIALWGDEITSKPVHLSKGNYKVKVIVKGSPAAGKFPHAHLWINNKNKTELPVTGTFAPGYFTFALQQDQHIKIKLTMDNDLLVPETKEDRNLFVREITFVRIGD